MTATATTLDDRCMLAVGPGMMDGAAAGRPSSAAPFGSARPAQRDGNPSSGSFRSRSARAGRRRRHAEFC